MADIDARETTKPPVYGSLIDWFESDMQRNSSNCRPLSEWFEEDIRRNSPYKSAIEWFEEDQKKHER